MEPSHKDCASDDGEPENPRMGEKEACYESLKKAAEKLMKGQVTSFTDMRLLETKLNKAEGIIKDQTDVIAKYSERNVKLTTMLEHQQKLLSSLEFEVKATQTMCNCIKEAVSTFGERVHTANEDVETTAKQMRRQEEAVTFLEAETKQLLQWKAEHQKKLKELEEREAQRKREIRQLEVMLDQSQSALSRTEQDKGRLQGQVAAGAEAMDKLDSKVASYRERLKQARTELLQFKEREASLRAALEESVRQGEGFSQVAKEQAEVAEKEKEQLLGQQANLLHDIATLRGQVNCMSEQNEARSTEIVNLNENLRTAEAQLRQQEERVCHLIAENETLTVSKAALLADLQAVHHALRVEKDETSKVAGERDEHAMMLFELHSALTDVKLHLEAEQVEHTKTKELAADLRVQVEQEQATTKLRDSELGSVRTDYKTQSQEIKLLRAERSQHEKLKVKTHELEALLSGSTAHASTLQHALESARELCTRVEEKLKTRDDENRKLADLLSEARRQNDLLQDSVRTEAMKLADVGNRLNMEQNRANDAFAQLSADRDLKEREQKKLIQKLQESLRDKEKEHQHALEHAKALAAEEHQRQATMVGEERRQFAAQLAMMEEVRLSLEAQIQALQKEPEVRVLTSVGARPAGELALCPDPSNEAEAEEAEETDDGKKRKRQARRPIKAKPAAEGARARKHGKEAQKATATRKKQRVVRKRRLPLQAAAKAKKSVDLFDDVFAFHSGSE